MPGHSPTPSLHTMSNPTPLSPLPNVAVAMSDSTVEPRLPEEEKKKKRKRWKTPAVASSSTSSGMENLSAPCTECGKSFNSAKALFGHMRCHPERQWRGINPPAARRLRLDEGQSTQEVVDAALTLMLISSGGMPAPEEARFVCSGCNREFGSYHALGGHRASHKNVKGCFANALEKKEDQEDGSSPRKVEKLERVRKEAGQEKVIIQGVAERLAMELDNHRLSNVKLIYHSGEQTKTQSANHRSVSKNIELYPHLDLNLAPTSIDESTNEEQPISREKLGLDLRLGI